MTFSFSIYCKPPQHEVCSFRLFFLFGELCFFVAWFHFGPWFYSSYLSSAAVKLSSCECNPVDEILPQTKISQIQQYPLQVNGLKIEFMGITLQSLWMVTLQDGFQGQGKTVWCALCPLPVQKLCMKTKQSRLPKTAYSETNLIAHVSFLSNPHKCIWLGFLA